MFKPKQIAPFFSMTPYHLSEILKEIHLVYPLNQTPLGSFLLSEKDLPVIETYQNTLRLFGNKKMTLVYMKDYMEGKTGEEKEFPEWYFMIKNKAN